MTAIDFELGKKAIVQVFYAGSDAIAGTGFWVGGRYLMTCAHVVGNALSLRDYSQAKGQSIRVAFDEAGIEQKLSAKVLDCQYDAREGRQDVAVLQLAEEALIETTNIRLASWMQQSMGGKMSVYGYVQGNKVGRNITAITNGRAKSWIQIEVFQDIGIPIQEGLSGSPVWCQQSQTYVGIVVARDDLCPEDRVGFMIPATELLSSSRLIQRYRLLDLLEPYEQRLSGQFVAAYQLCRNRNAVGNARSHIADILKDLANRGSGDENSPNRLVQFVACLLNSLEQATFSELITALMTWAGEITDDLASVREKMREVALKQQNQSVVPLNPLLLVSVSQKNMESTPTFSVQAWLIPNPNKYNPATGKGAETLSLKGYVDTDTDTQLSNLAEAFEYQQLPLLITAYLSQICREGLVCKEGIDLSELTIELFLPFSLMNQPSERLGLSRLGFIEPLGISDPDCPQVLLRSQDRLDQPMADSRWRKKWAQVETSRQEATTKVLASDRKTLKRDLKNERTLGMKLSASPMSTNSGEIARLVISGAPIAVWVRTHPSAEALFNRLEQDVLAHPLGDFPKRVLSLRRDTQELDNESDYVSSEELGHHLAVLWENPRHVPPSYRYSASRL
ncbi:MAG: trypsin-like peptidase domain-containing protein [Cyanobacteria bacterium J06560_6]